MFNALPDPGKEIIDRVLALAVDYRIKVHSLAYVEKQIEKLYADGLTSVKPCRLMTPDDLVH